MTAIYERQRGESKAAYEAFKIYLEERDFSRVADISAKSLSEIEKLADKYSWEDRADIYDFEKANNETIAAEQDYKAMLDFQINLGRMLQVKGAKTLQDTTSKDEKTALAVKMVTSGVDIERSARKAKRNVLRQ